MIARRFLIVLSLATAGIAFAAPPAAADSCSSTILENTLCTPANAVYCAIYSTKSVVSCEAGVAAHCIDACPDDLAPATSGIDPVCTPYANVLGSKQRTCVDADSAPACGAWSEGWSQLGYWRVCYGTDSLAIGGCIRDICLA